MRSPELSRILEQISELAQLTGTAESRVRIRTKEKCPKCKGKFQETPLGLLCPKCITTPRRYYVYLSWKGRKIKVYSFRDGQPLSSWEMAQRARELISHEIESGTFDPSRWVKKDVREFLFENYIEKWLEFSESRLKPSSLKDRRRIAKNILIPFFKGKDIRDIRAAHIQDFYLELQGRGLSEKTIWNTLMELKTFLNFARKREDLERVPAFPEIKVREKPIVWLTREDQKRILEHIPDEHKPIFIFLFTYGCRPGEARALCWDAVDFEKEIIYIKRTFSAKKLVDVPKEGKWKVFPMLPHIKTILEDLYRKKRSMFVFSWRYDHYGERALPRIWKDACKKAGIQGVSLYAGVRHSFAMQRLHEGFSYEEIGACLGHSDVRTTRRYGRLMARELTKVFSHSAPVVDLSEYRRTKTTDNRE